MVLASCSDIPYMQPQVEPQCNVSHNPVQLVCAADIAWSAGRKMGISSACFSLTCSPHTSCYRACLNVTVAPLTRVKALLAFTHNELAAQGGLATLCPSWDLGLIRINLTPTADRVCEGNLTLTLWLSNKLKYQRCLQNCPASHHSRRHGRLCK